MIVIGYTMDFPPGLYNKACEKEYGSIQAWCKDVKISSKGNSGGDVVFETLRENKQTATDYNNETGLLTVMLESPIPESIAKEEFIDTDMKFIYYE